MPPCASTIGGYKKREVYGELERALLACDAERTCYLAAELFCSKGEIPSLVSFMIDHYAQHRCSSCLPQLQRTEQELLDLVRRASAATASARSSRSSKSSMSSKSSSSTADVRLDGDTRRLLCGTVIRIVRADIKTHWMPRVDLTALNGSSAASASSEAPELAQVAMEHLMEDDSDAVDADLARALHAVAAGAHPGNPSQPRDADRNTRRTLSLVMCILRMYPKLLRDIKWNDVYDVKKDLRQDSVWILWKLAFGLAQASNSLMRFTSSSFNLYKQGLSKANRESRVNLLLYVYLCLCKGGVRKTPPPDPPELARALDTADLLFDDVLRNAASAAQHLGQNAYEKEHASLAKQAAAAAHAPKPAQAQALNHAQTHALNHAQAQALNHARDPSVQPIDSSQLDKLKVMRVITYSDPARQVRQQLDDDIERAHGTAQAQQVKSVVISKAFAPLLPAGHVQQQQQQQQQQLLQLQLPLPNQNQHNQLTQHNQHNQHNQLNQLTQHAQHAQHARQQLWGGGGPLLQPSFQRW